MAYYYLIKIIQILIYIFYPSPPPIEKNPWYATDYAFINYNCKNIRLYFKIQIIPDIS